MALETDLQAMSRHLVDRLNAVRATLLLDTKPVFQTCVYGEPRVIAKWPLLSVQPADEIRELTHTRQFTVDFKIFVVLYHGIIGETLDIQEGAQKRITVIKEHFMTDFKWNFVDTSDATKDKVVFGFPRAIDHPIAIAPEGELWSASRIELTGTSREVF